VLILIKGVNRPSISASEKEAFLEKWIDNQKVDVLNELTPIGAIIRLAYNMTIKNKSFYN